MSPLTSPMLVSSLSILEPNVAHGHKWSEATDASWVGPRELFSFPVPLAQELMFKVVLIFRIFTLKESFWFALTSFTPQGGGEAPKSLSGRVLVAAYWLFVVLMLATFTANLAAFLTVERMQTTVQGENMIS